MKKIILCLLVLALLPGSLTALGAQAQPSAPEGYTLVDFNDALALFADFESGNIILSDRAAGYLWRSNPEGEDSKARGVHRQTLLSQITVNYTNERGTSLSLTSAADAVNAGGLMMEIMNGELQAVYDFVKPRIRIKVSYVLAADHLKVLVPTEGIEYYPDEGGVANLNAVTAVDVLPVMGAGRLDENGWLLVPDGSGALIRFNNGVTSMAEYNANVYGKDPGVEGQIGVTATLAQQARTVEQTARLPVFGVFHEEADQAHGLLGIITQNDAKAAILARVSNLTSYNYAWSRFRVRSTGSMMMNSKEFGSSVIGVSERAGLTGGSYEVRYYPLAGKQASTAGMAAVYRDFLIREMGLAQRVREGQYPLYLELYGQVKKAAQLLGIPYTKTVSLTTLEDIRAIVNALEVPQTVVRYAGWMPDTFFELIPLNARLAGNLGKTEGLAALHEELLEKGGGLFPAADLLNVYKAGRGFWAIRDSVLAPVNSPQLQFQTSYSSRAADPNLPPWYLLSPSRYAHFFGRFFDSYNQLGLPGLALDAIGEIATSDNRSSGGTGRGAVPAIVREVLLQSGKTLMLTGGNAYAASLASHLLNSPAASSSYTLADEAIPFYQMVFHGQIPYGIGAVNHNSDPDAFLLRCLEYGASPQFAFVGRHAQELENSRLVFLYSPDYIAWQDTVREGYERLREVLSPLAALPITFHQNLEGGGAMTVYGNQTAVYVNYADTDLALDGFAIPAGGYIVREVFNGAD